ncbi:hypothetical protein GEV33_002490 [Tenebrio molitor]|uniref:Uncharacterized protein n=1 Tax=Tenebrio molitor TaxID=7067 RepID=A0A8J6HUV3_TENMO|nr:hypothetical protein GEV33_002490 [Tenebrio molitor]
MGYHTSDAYSSLDLTSARYRAFKVSTSCIPLSLRITKPNDLYAAEIRPGDGEWRCPTREGNPRRNNTKFLEDEDRFLLRPRKDYGGRDPREVMIFVPSSKTATATSASLGDPLDVPPRRGPCLVQRRPDGGCNNFLSSATGRFLGGMTGVGFPRNLPREGSFIRTTALEDDFPSLNPLDRTPFVRIPTTSSFPNVSLLLSTSPKL